MTKPVGLLPAAHFKFPSLPNPFKNNVTKVVQPLLKGRPTSPPPPPPLPDLIGQDSKEACFRLRIDYNQKTITPVFIPPCIKTPLDKVFLRATLRNAEKAAEAKEEGSAFGFYMQAMQLISSAILDTKGLLMGAVCYLNTAQFLRDHHKDSDPYTQQATTYLKNLNKNLLVDTAPEKKDVHFMCSVGAAQLVLARSGSPATDYANAINSFQEALKLSKDSPLPKSVLDPIIYRIHLGLGFSFLYLARTEILDKGTHRREELLKYLQSSRSYLEIALSLHSPDLVKYTLALNYSWTVLLLDEAEADLPLNGPVQENLKNAESFNEGSKEHLNKALEILKPLSPKTNNMLALWGTLEYKAAYFRADFSAQYEAFQHLSLAASTSLASEDDSLLISCGDSICQLAWRCPIDFFQKQAEDYLKIIYEESYEEMFISESMRAIFEIQRALWHLIESNHKLVVKNEPTKETPLLKQKIEEPQKKAEQNPQVLEEMKKDLIKNLFAHEIQRKKALQDLKSNTQDLKKKPRPVLERLEVLKNKAVKQLRILESQTKNTAEEIKILDGMKKAILSHLKEYENLKKITLKDMREKAIQVLENNLDNLKGFLADPSDDIYFNLIKTSLKTCTLALKTNLPKLEKICNTPQEVKAYHFLAHSIGHQFHGIYVSALFKWMLTERLRSFELLLELEPDFIKD